jgi:hypothetical protein
MRFVNVAESISLLLRLCVYSALSNHASTSCGTIERYILQIGGEMKRAVVASSSMNSKTTGIAAWYLKTGVLY